MDKRRSVGTELPCKLREGLSLLIRRLSRMRSSSGEEQQEIILKSLREACYQDGKGQTFKDKIPNSLRSCVVYSFMCRCCSVTYLGQTVRHLHTRVSEHLGVFPLTGSKSSNPIMSIVSFPILIALATPPLLMIDFKIISCCSSPDELLIRESLLINKLKPSLNLQGSSVPTLLLLSIPLSIFVI